MPITINDSREQQRQLKPPLPFKGIHVRGVGDGIVIRRSTIDGAGNGLFADTLFSKGAIVTEYQGVEIARDDIHHVDKAWKHFGFKSRNHVIPYAKGKGILGPIIIGLSDRRDANLRHLGGGSFLNDPRDRTHINCVYKDGANRVFIKSTREILQGEELFVSYGRTYWKRVLEHDC